MGNSPHERIRAATEEGQRFIAAPLSIIVKTPKVGKALKDWIFNTALDEATK